MRRRRVLVLMSATLLFVFIFATRVVPYFGFTDYEEMCHDKLYAIDEDARLRTDSLPELSDDEPRKSENNIFFHETSSCGDVGRVLSARQACAVESAAKMNPSMTIYLLILTPIKLSNVSQRIAKELTKYENVRIRGIAVDNYVKNTPIEEWYASGVLKTSKWPISHISDMLRYLTLWKFGGIYLDLDFVITTSLEGLTNFVGAENNHSVAAGVLSFNSSGIGRQLADACIREIKTNFRGDIWGHNGPGVITRNLQKLCATEHAKDMTKARCHGFTVFPPSAFYPIHYREWRRYFEKENTNETMRKIYEARAIHIWNKFSTKQKVVIGSQVPYDIVAKKYCPITHKTSGNTL